MAEENPEESYDSWDGEDDGGEVVSESEESTKEEAKSGGNPDSSLRGPRVERVESKKIAEGENLDAFDGQIR